MSYAVWPLASEAHDRHFPSEKDHFVMPGFEVGGQRRSSLLGPQTAGLVRTTRELFLDSVPSPPLACVLPLRREESPAIPRIPCVTPETVLIKPEEPEQVCVLFSGAGGSKAG